MPTATIEVRKTYTREEGTNIIDAIHAAMMEGLKTPQWDKNIRLVVHSHIALRVRLKRMSGTRW